jgi:hypothetical protein
MAARLAAAGTRLGLQIAGIESRVQRFEFFQASPLGVIVGDHPVGGHSLGRNSRQALSDLLRHAFRVAGDIPLFFAP